MGYESRKNVEIKQLGKFNVKVILYFTDGTDMTVYADSWEDTPANLALAYKSGTALNPVSAFKVIPHFNLKFFDVMSQSDEDLDRSKDN